MVQRRCLIAFCSKPLSERCFHARSIFLSTQPQSKTDCFCLRLCRKLQRVNTKHFNICLLVTKSWYMHFTTSLNIKEVMNNFPTNSVRIHVQNNQNKFPPWFLSLPTPLLYSLIRPTNIFTTNTILILLNVVGGRGGLCLFLSSQILLQYHINPLILLNVGGVLCLFLSQISLQQIPY